MGGPIWPNNDVTQWSDLWSKYSALSGWGTSWDTNCERYPVCDQGLSPHPGAVTFVAGILEPDPDQNHPLICLGWRWGACNICDYLYRQEWDLKRHNYITSMEVTESATGPDSIRPVLVDDVLNHGVLLGSLDAHQVHAHAPADVPGIQPTNLQWNNLIWLYR